MLQMMVPLAEKIREVKTTFVESNTSFNPCSFKSPSGAKDQINKTDCQDDTVHWRCILELSALTDFYLMAFNLLALAIFSCDIPQAQ